MPLQLRVRNLVLVQPATSATYDLVPALRRIDGQLIHLFSPGDRLILGWGTSTFGNSDRTYGPAAGKIGFDLEKAVPDLNLRERVRQEPWSQAWRDAGHYGNHIGMLGYQWNREIVAPLLLSEVPMNAARR
jgi:hypothetical protein